MDTHEAAKLPSEVPHKLNPQLYSNRGTCGTNGREEERVKVIRKARGKENTRKTET
jgi:hypothetical protein